MKARIAIAVVSLMALTACGDSQYSTESNMEAPSAANYTVAIDWRRIPADNDMATDIYVRFLVIQGVCFLQTASVHDWQYSMVPVDTGCTP